MRGRFSPPAAPRLQHKEPHHENSFHRTVRTARPPEEALHPLHALLEAHLGVAALIDAPDGDAVLGQQLLQQLHDGDLEAVDAQS